MGYCQRGSGIKCHELPHQKPQAVAPAGPGRPQPNALRLLPAPLAGERAAGVRVLLVQGRRAAGHRGQAGGGGGSAGGGPAVVGAPPKIRPQKEATPKPKKERLGELQRFLGWCTGWPLRAGGFFAARPLEERTTTGRAAKKPPARPVHHPENRSCSVVTQAHIPLLSLNLKCALLFLLGLGAVVPAAYTQQPAASAAPASQVAPFNVLPRYTTAGG